MVALSNIKGDLNLVGGLEHGFIFPYIGKNHPNWLFIFFRGVETTNQKRWFKDGDEKMVTSMVILCTVSNMLKHQHGDLNGGVNIFETINKGYFLSLLHDHLIRWDLLIRWSEMRKHPNLWQLSWENDAQPIDSGG